MNVPSHLQIRFKRISLALHTNHGGAHAAVNSSRSKSATPRQSTVRPAGSKPVDKFIDGPVHVSIWQNNGSKGAFRTASFELRYKNDQEQWQTGRSYSASNLKHLESAAREARSRIEAWQQAIAPTPHALT
jgi:hypothetical protein